MTDAQTIGNLDGAKKGKVADIIRRFHTASPFAKSFTESLVAGIVIFILLIVWMGLRADLTAEKIQSLIPYKTAEIETGGVAAKPEASVKIETATETAPIAPVPVTEALSPAPMEGLTEMKDGHVLPISRLSDDMTPFQAYKRAFTAQAGKSLVSVVVVDFGLSESLSQSALDKLPADISFVLTPYAEKVAQWGTEARSHGHEFWVSLPMETKDTSAEDTGPDTLLINAPLEENQKRLFSVLGSVRGYVGLVSQKNHNFNQQDLDVNPMLKQIFGRGLAFAESNPGVMPFGFKMAQESGYPYVQNTMWLDADLRPENIDRILQALELQATKNGRAILFVQPSPIVLTKVQEWLKGANERGLQIAPLSAMAQ